MAFLELKLDVLLLATNWPADRPLTNSMSIPLHWVRNSRVQSKHIVSVSFPGFGPSCLTLDTVTASSHVYDAVRVASE
jgi:hypothetical protein